MLSLLHGRYLQGEVVLGKFDLLLSATWSKMFLNLWSRIFLEQRVGKKVDLHHTDRLKKWCNKIKSFNKILV